MSTLSLLLAATTSLAAGSVVDVGIASETRASVLSEPVADGFSNTLLVSGITPSLRAAYQGPSLFLDANYAPEISLIYPSSDILLVMHRFGAQAGTNISPRLNIRADLTGAIGDLDAGAAVRDLGNSRVGALVGGGNLTQFPFADVIAGADLGYRIDRRFTFNTGMRLEGTGSPSPGEDEQLIIPPQLRPQAHAGLTYLLTPTDSVTVDLETKAAILADGRGIFGRGGGYVGFAPTLAYNRTLMNGVVASTTAGWLTAFVDEGIKRDVLLHGLPISESRLAAAVNLNGEGAIEGTILFGVAPFSDPLGGLLEERISGAVQGAWRVNRTLSFTTSVSAFGTLYAVGGNALIAQEAQTSVGGTVGASYNLTEWIALNAEAIGTSRVIVDKFGRLAELRPEMTMVFGIQGAFNAFHDGERPAGTDPRPGRSVGTQAVSLPGSATAFNGKLALEKKMKKKSSGFGQSNARRGTDDDLDQDDVLDRRRRGMRVDERRLQRQRLEKKKKKLEDAQEKIDALKALEEAKLKEAEDAESKIKADADAAAAAKKKRKKKREKADKGDD